jgi:hypothetical protein
MRNLFLLFFLSFLFLGCGVKGKPLPPLDPVQIGDGRLLYQKDPSNRPKPKKTVTAPIDEQFLEEK